MIKIEKERKFKREYIPVILGCIILILFFALLVLTINYDGNITKENIESTNVISDTDDLAVDKTDSKCSKDELNSLVASANKVSAEYYAIKKQVVDEFATEDVLDTDDGLITHNLIEISISGISEDIYVIIENNYDDYILTIKPTDVTEDGTYKFEGRTNLQKVRYTVSIYANNSECQDELLRKVTFTTKIYNTFTDSMACVIYPNYSNCAVFLDKELDYETFRIGYMEYQKEHKESEESEQLNIIKALASRDGATEEQIETIGNQKGENKKENVILNKLEENKELIIIAIVIISIGILIVILLMFIRRNKI